MLSCFPGPDFTEENIALAEKNQNFSLNATASSKSLVSPGCVINNGLGMCNHRPLFQEITGTLNYDTHRSCYCFKGTKGSRRVTHTGGEKDGHQKGLFIITTLRLRFVYK